MRNRSRGEWAVAVYAVVLAFLAGVIVLGQPSNLPVPSRVSVSTTTNGTLMYPTNFLQTNVIAGSNVAVNMSNDGRIFIHVPSLAAGGGIATVTSNGGVVGSLLTVLEFTNSPTVTPTVTSNGGVVSVSFAAAGGPGGGGESNTMSVTGGGAIITNPKAGVDLPIKSFQKSTNGVGTNIITWATNGTEIWPVFDWVTVTNGLAPTNYAAFLSTNNVLVTNGANTTVTPLLLANNVLQYTIAGEDTNNLMGNEMTNKFVYNVGGTASNLTAWMTNINNTPLKIRAMTGAASNLLSVIDTNGASLLFGVHANGNVTTTGTNDAGRFRMTAGQANGAVSMSTNGGDFTWATDVARTTITNGLAGILTNANILYVATNGNDATAVRGRIDRPWLSLSNACKTLVNGDLMLIGAGTHYVNGITDMADGPPVKFECHLRQLTNVTIRGAGMNNTRIYATNAGGVFHLWNVNGLEMSDFTMTMNKSNSYVNLFAAIDLSNDATNSRLWFHGLGFTNQGNHCIARGNGSEQCKTTNVVVENCFFWVCGATNLELGVRDGVCIGGIGADTKIRNNYFYGVYRAFEPEGESRSYDGATFEGNTVIDCSDRGVMISPGSPEFAYSRMTIRNNHFKILNRANVFQGEGGGFITVGVGRNVLIEGNYFDNYPGIALWFEARSLVGGAQSITNAIVARNVFTSCDYAMLVRGVAPSNNPVENVIILNNVFYQSAKAPVVDIEAKNVFVQDNIFDSWGDGAGSMAIRMRDPGATYGVSTNVFIFNNMFRQPASWPGQVGVTVGNTTVTNVYIRDNTFDGVVTPVSVAAGTGGIYAWNNWINGTNWYVPNSTIHKGSSLTNLTGVANNFAGLATGQVLEWNGVTWTNATDDTSAGAGISTVKVNGTNALLAASTLEFSNTVTMSVNAVTNSGGIVAITHHIQSAVTNVLATTNYAAFLSTNNVLVTNGANVTVTPLTIGDHIVQYTIALPDAALTNGQPVHAAANFVTHSNNLFKIRNLTPENNVTNFVMDFAFEEQLWTGIATTNSLYFVHATNKPPIGYLWYSQLEIRTSTSNLLLHVPAAWHVHGTNASTTDFLLTSNTTYHFSFKCSTTNETAVHMNRPVDTE